MGSASVGFENNSRLGCLGPEEATSYPSRRSNMRVAIILGLGGVSCVLTTFGYDHPAFGRLKSLLALTRLILQSCN